jgi:thioredoxin reductase (NADPH)
MVKPTILSIDDEVPVLRAVERDLKRRFRSEYRIMKASSGPEALGLLRKLKERNDAVALLLADQRMPDMTGTQFLAEARSLYPDARKVLLTAYADTEAAIASINTIGLDFYLMKPWDPPEEHLYPILEDLLEGWQATADAPYDGIRVAGTLWSATSHEIKDFLARNRVPYRWVDIEQDGETRTMVEGLQEGAGGRRLPVVFLPDGTTLVAPERAGLAAAMGMRTEARNPFYDLVVVGAGPAGLAAAVYGASEGLSTVAVEQAATGGQAGTSSRIENYLGFPNGLSGSDLARRAQAQAERLGAELLVPQQVTAVRREDPYRVVTLADGSEINCYALLLSTGVAVRRLEVPGIEALTGAGVYYGAALTEAAHYRDRPVLVVGGANSAGQGAMFFSRYASEVTMLVRGDSLDKSMSRYLIDQIAATPNIQVKTRHTVVEALGDSRFAGLRVRDDDGATHDLAAAALFIFIGAAPRAELVADLVECSDTGYVLTGPALPRAPDGTRPRGWTLKREPMLLETSVPGIFAAGDVREGSSKRVAAAVGEGSVAVQMIHRYLETV